MIQKKISFNTIQIANLFLFVSCLTLFSSCEGRHERQTIKNGINVATLMQKVDAQTIPVAILGGGSAGLTAGVYASQANIPCTLFEGPKPGGALAQSHSVRNWPGVIDAPGAKIVGNIREQAEEGGVTIKQEVVVAVDFSSRPFTIQTQDVMDASKKHTYKALTCVIAMGSEPIYLGIPGETGPNGYWGRGVGNCAVCEGSLYKGKNVAVVGGGDAAIVEAGYLADIANQVTIFVRKDAFRAKDLASRDRALAKPNVKVVFDTSITEVIGNGTEVTHLLTKNNKTGQETKVAMDGLFLAIGSRPNTALFKDQLTIDEQGFVVLKDDQETSVKGVYAAGDICEKHWIQAIRAADQGYIAAMQAKKFLDVIGYDAAKFSKPTEQPVPVEEKKKHYTIEINSDADVAKYILNNNSPVVIDFFATWCIPCQNMAPVVEQLAQEFDGKVTFVKINIQGSVNMKNLTNKIGSGKISAVPTFAFVKNGRHVGGFAGMRDIDTFRRFVQSLL